MSNRRIFAPASAGPSLLERFRVLSTTLRARRAELDPLVTVERAGAAFDASWRGRFKGRVRVVAPLLVLWALAIQGRLVILHVFEHDWLMAKARDIQQRDVTIEALRGDIVDRHGQLVAYSVAADSIVADPSLIDDTAKAAASICAALADCTRRDEQELLAKLSAKGSHFATIRQARMVKPLQVDRVRALALKGVFTKSDTRRYYPQYELASQLLGFVGADNAGQAGLERAYNAAIAGRDGKAQQQIYKSDSSLETVVERPAEAGATLELALDLRLQHIVERELKSGVDTNHARAGTAVVMNPMTGEILALACYPTFNPNAVGASAAESRKNCAAANIYEPGSTFKMITASAAIEQGVIQPSDLVDTSPGSITILGRKPIFDTHHYGVLTFEDVIVKSSNVGAIRVGLRVGSDRMSQYVDRFGFGQVFSKEFPGASRGIRHEGHLDDSSLASISMGYQIGVTPLQMVMAASVIANGGLLMEPHAVRAVTRDGHREAVQPRVLRRVVERSTAATLTTIMEAVVTRGTATAAKLDHYQVAGKTGTAALVLPSGGYSKTDYHASFVGFVPSRRPVYTILVVIEAPHAGTYYGGSVAAPVFKKIADAALAYEGVPPTIAPAAPVRLASGATLPTLRPQVVETPVFASVGAETGRTPDVRHLSMREAVSVLTRAGLPVQAIGSGIVVAQTPAAGTPINPATRVVLRFEQDDQDDRDREGGL